MKRYSIESVDIRQCENGWLVELKFVDVDDLREYVFVTWGEVVAFLAGVESDAR